MQALRTGLKYVAAAGVGGLGSTAYWVRRRQQERSHAHERVENARRQVAAHWAVIGNIPFRRIAKAALPEDPAEGTLPLQAAILEVFLASPEACFDKYGCSGQLDDETAFCLRLRHPQIEGEVTFEDLPTTPDTKKMGGF